MNNAKTRTSSCITHKPTQLAVIMKDDFQLIEQNIQEEKEQKNEFIIENLPEIGQMHATSVVEQILYSVK